MESDRTWTAAQQEAIDYVDGSLLVSAAAGSGKTAVLAARCAKLVCHPTSPCDVDQLLVVTFTRAAAAEMRARIENEITREIDKHPEDARLQEQRALLPKLQVGTLHGFCGELIRKHFHLLGIDPAVRLLSEDEIKLLRLDTVRELFEKRFDDDKNQQFSSLVDHYANGYDESLIEAILGLHDLLGSMIDPEEWKAQAQSRLTIASTGSLDQSELGKAFLQVLIANIHSVERACASARKRLAELEGFAKYAGYLEVLQNAATSWDRLAGKGIELVCAAIREFQLGKLPPASSELAGKEFANGITTAARDVFKEGLLPSLAKWSIPEWQAGLKQIVPHAQELIAVVGAFAQLYDSRKQELRAIDFNDLEHLALKLLRVEGATAVLPSDVALHCQRQFRHVLVDEYQDINAVQDAILRLLSRETSTTAPTPTANFFCVGDVKQSIYRFRLAQPERFLNRDAALRLKGNRIGRVIDLRENFRSRKKLLDAANRVFSRLLVGGSTEIDYDGDDKAHWLRAAADYPKADPRKSQLPGAPIEFHLIGKLPKAGADGEAPSPAAKEYGDIDRQERDAAFIAHRINQLLGKEGNKPAQVCVRVEEEDFEYRDIVPGDIAVLLRATRVNAERYQRQFRKFGINSILDSATGFFDAVEIMDMLALLSVLDNQKQDIALAAMLRSPLVRLSDRDNSLARIRLTAPSGMPFHDAVARYPDHHSDNLATELRVVLTQLNDWRRLANQSPVADVLQQVFDQTCYPTFCHGLRDGPQRVANLLELCDRARDFDATQYRGLSRFLKFLQLIQADSDLGTPSPASAEQGAVRVMSIHKSKGLEFPVVFLPDLAKAHNLQDLRKMIMFDRDAHLAMDVVNLETRVKYPSMASIVVADALERKMQAEELRVLYVAMTRAKEHLILVGTGDDATIDTWVSDWEDHQGRFPEDAVLAGRSYQDWLGPTAVCANVESSGSFEFVTHPFEEIANLLASVDKPAIDDHIAANVLALKPLQPAPKEDDRSKQTREFLTNVYPHEAFTKIAAVQSVTAQTKTGTSAPGGKSPSLGPVVKFDPTLKLPKFLDNTTTPADIGTATHAALEYLDFARAGSTDAIRHQLKNLATRRLLTEQQFNAVDVDAILWLMSSEIGALLKTHHAQLMREVPIFYPREVVLDGTAPVAASPLDRVMIRGRIDVVIPTASGVLVADYKTDRVTAETIDARTLFYVPQLSAYAQALSRIMGAPVQEAALVFLHPRRLKRFKVV